MIQAEQFKIETRKDDRGLPVFFVTRNGVNLTSRWMLDDAKLALASFRDRYRDLAA